jgi:23S rRNA (adenine2030-N6)-methyltransferase
MFAAFRGAYGKWPTGVYALWHPIKDAAEARPFYAAFRESGVRRALRLELSIGGEGEGLRRTGLVVVNPPFVFEEEARALLPFLSHRLAQGPDTGFEVDWLAGE